MAELADAQDLGSCVLDMRVRAPPSAPILVRRIAATRSCNPLFSCDKYSLYEGMVKYAFF